MPQEYLAAFDDLAANGAEMLRSPKDPTPTTREEIEQAEPRWDDQTLPIADAIRRGQMRLAVEPEPNETSRNYAARIATLSERFPLVNFFPARPELMAAGQANHQRDATEHAESAQAAAQIAGVTVPGSNGWTLHQAIELYAKDVAEHMNAKTALNEAATARRLKDASPDMPLDQFGYSALEAIKRYWARRPPAKRPGAKGRPIAVSTAVNTVKTLRRFVRWMHRHSDIPWRQPDDVQEALRLNVKRLKKPDEIAAMARGPETFTDEELALLYAYATDYERLLLLLGLNLGFAQAECSSLRRDEVHRDDDIPKVKRMRHKSQVYHEVAIWPETLKGVDWLVSQRATSVYVLTTEAGGPCTSNRIANRWNALLNRVQTDHSEFRRLSFKFLRKTAGQLVRDFSDGETVAVFHARAQVNIDEYSDAYSRRDFRKVFEANRRVRERLEPMFAGVEAFQVPRKRGGPNLSPGCIERIQKLGSEGVKPTEIARLVGVSRPTVYRYVGNTEAV